MLPPFMSLDTGARPPQAADYRPGAVEDDASLISRHNVTGIDMTLILLCYYLTIQPNGQ